MGFEFVDDIPQYANYEEYSRQEPMRAFINNLKLMLPIFLILCTFAFIATYEFYDHQAREVYFAEVKEVTERLDMLIANKESETYNGF